MYDLIIKNGRVIDPARGTDGVETLYIRGGVLAAPHHQGQAQAVREIDAAGCLVLPGLIDAHTHLFRGGSEFGAHGDLICLPNGVTTAIDAGSAGLYNFSAFCKGAIAQADTTIKALIHPSFTGVQGAPHEEVQDPALCTLEHLLPLFERHPHTLAGIKLRVHAHVTAGFGLAALEQGAKTARALRERGFSCRLTIHLGDLAPGITLADVLSLLEAGDVLCHIYRGGETTILTPDGAVHPAMLQARRRGVIFDTACSRPYLSLKVLAAAVEQDFLPDLISTDMTRRTMYWAPSFSLPYKMSLYCNGGVPLEKVIRAATAAPAAAYGLEGQAGSLAPGMPADVAILRELERPYTVDDLYGASLPCTRQLVPMATVKGGKPVFQQLFL